VIYFLNIGNFSIQRVEKVKKVKAG